MKDVLIVGSGITGCTLAWTWLLKGKSVVMISDHAPAASAVAAGVYNPTVLKRFTPVWKAKEQLDHMLPFYQAVEQHIGKSLLTHIPIMRRLHDTNEVKTWTRKAARPDLCDFMSPQVLPNHLETIEAPMGFGKVTPAGWCDTSLFMHSTINYLTAQDAFIRSSFDYDALRLNDAHVSYKDVQARHIIFAEGVAMCHNPFYKHLPLQGNKGELLIVRIAGLQLDCIVKSSVFLMHFKDDLFWVGATYNRDDLTSLPTQDAYEYLTTRLERFLKLPYEIVAHQAGIRPTTNDRRPFVGSLDPFKRHFICNGMGSRAVLLAPWVAAQLFEHVAHEQPLDHAIDCNRFSGS